MPEHQQIQQSKKTNTIFQKQATPVIQTPLSNPYSIIQRAKINPKSLTRADVMQLQRTIGNRAVAQLLSGIVNSSTAHKAPIQRSEIPEEEEPLQGKMVRTVQRQEIPEEEEPLQGKMIGIVQRQEIPEGEEPLQGKIAETVQRQEIPEEEEPLQGKFENKLEIACPSCIAAPLVQRQEIPEEEEPLQGKFTGTVQLQGIPEEEPLQGKMIETVQRQEISEEEEPLQPKRENNTGMPDNLKAGVETLSGIDMSDVRVHYNSDKPAEVGALAYTQGTNIHVAPGQEKHLPHEAWHVVQQAQGRVRPTFQLKGVGVNDDFFLETEADSFGAKADKHEARKFDDVSFDHKVTSFYQFKRAYINKSVIMQRCTGRQDASNTWHTFSSYKPTQEIDNTHWMITVIRRPAGPILDHRLVVLEKFPKIQSDPTSGGDEKLFHLVPGNSPSFRRVLGSLIASLPAEVHEKAWSKEEHVDSISGSRSQIIDDSQGNNMLRTMQSDAQRTDLLYLLSGGNLTNSFNCKTWAFHITGIDF